MLFGDGNDGTLKSLFALTHQTKLNYPEFTKNAWLCWGKETAKSKKIVRTVCFSLGSKKTPKFPKFSRDKKPQQFFSFLGCKLSFFLILELYYK